MKNIFNSGRSKAGPSAGPLMSAIGRVTHGLTYISETDAAVASFAGGPCKEVTAQAVAEAAGIERGTTVREVAVEAFFAKLTAHKDWFGEAEATRAKKFLELGKLLEGSLSDLKVFKFGRTQIEIFVVGIDAEGHLAGVRTRAVET